MQLGRTSEVVASWFRHVSRSPWISAQQARRNLHSQYSKDMEKTKPVFALQSVDTSKAFLRRIQMAETPSGLALQKILKPHITKVQ